MERYLNYPNQSGSVGNKEMSKKIIFGKAQSVVCGLQFPRILTLYLSSSRDRRKVTSPLNIFLVVRIS
jgi:hypothetical protein